MISKNYRRFSASLLLIFSILTVSLPPSALAQTSPAQTSNSANWQAQLAQIEQKVEERRKELGIPGIGLAIVKDDKIIFMKGFGYKDFERKIPVTADTQFAIGSSTKAFTALSILMSQDEGKLSLDDSPKKYIPYFKINDPEIDKNITVRDLMAHSSGLNRTDLGWITGKLNREEIIRVAGDAKPMAKLRERFFYQNVMFLAAGEITAAVQKMPWSKFVPERIFKPLGMTNSTMSLKEMQKTKDFSFGYEYNFDTKETRRLPLRDIDEIAPAGAINSSARDMTNWLKFVINRGELNGKRLISEKSYEEWTKPQMKIAGTTAYGLGWFIRDWKGLKVVEHGGNIDGFNALVATIPEKKLGFVMLTNVSGSSLGDELMPIIWKTILESPTTMTASTTGTITTGLEKEAGKYRFEAAGFDIDVQMQNGKLVAVIPNQPTYTLENVGARRYKLGGAPDGFFVTFKDTEIYLEQPQGNYTLPRVGVDGKIIAATTVVKSSDAVKELVGEYQRPNGGGTIEIRDVNGKISLVVGNQQPYELKEKSKDLYSTLPLPDSYNLKATRSADGKLEGIVMIQPEGEFPFKFIGAGNKSNQIALKIDELMAKTLDALGGETNWRKFNSRVTKFDVDFENQGVKGTGTTFEKASNMSATEINLTALGKPIAEIRDFFDGTMGGETTTFSPDDVYTGQRLEDVKYESDFYGLANWKTGLKQAEIRGTEKVGDEETYVVKIQPERASEVTYYISTKTFLPVKKTSIVVSSTSARKTPISELFSDYRPVDGVMIPFKTMSSNPGMGAIVTRIKEVKHNVAIDDATFKAKSKKMTAAR